MHGCAARQNVRPVDVDPAEIGFVDITAFAARIDRYAQRGPFPSQRDIGGRAQIAAGRTMLGQRGPRHSPDRGDIEFRSVGNQPDDASQRARPVKRALRALEHLDPFEVGQPQIGIGSVVAQPQIAQILPDGRLGGARKAGIRDPANEQLVAPAAKMGRGYRRYPLGDLFRAADAAQFERFSVDDGHLRCQFGQARVALARGHDDGRPRLRDRKRIGCGRARGGGQGLGPGWAKRGPLGPRHDLPGRLPDPNGFAAHRPGQSSHRFGHVHAAADAGRAPFGQHRMGHDDAAAGLASDRDH